MSAPYISSLVLPRHNASQMMPQKYSQEIYHERQSHHTLVTLIIVELLIVSSIHASHYCLVGDEQTASLTLLYIV